jgi:hypothetical protein
MKTFSKVNSSGEVVERPFLMIKTSEQSNPKGGLSRLREMGWLVGDDRDVIIKGQIVTRK